MLQQKHTKFIVILLLCFIGSNQVEDNEAQPSDSAAPQLITNKSAEEQNGTTNKSMEPMKTFQVQFPLPTSPIQSPLGPPLQPRTSNIEGSREIDDAVPHSSQAFNAVDTEDFGVPGFKYSDGTFIPLQVFNREQLPWPGSHMVDRVPFKNTEILNLSQNLSDEALKLMDRERLPESIKAIDKWLQNRYKQVSELPVRFYQNFQFYPEEAYRIVYGGLNASENFIVLYHQQQQMQVVQRYNLIYKSGAPYDLATEPIGSNTFENDYSESEFLELQNDEQMRQIQNVLKQLKRQSQLISYNLSRYYIIGSESEDSKLMKIIFEDGERIQNFIVVYVSDEQIEIPIEYDLIPLPIAELPIDNSELSFPWRDDGVQEDVIPPGWNVFTHEKGEQPIFGFQNSDGSFFPVTLQNSEILLETKDPIANQSDTNDDTPTNTTKIPQSVQEPMNTYAKLMDRQRLPNDIKAIDKELQGQQEFNAHEPIRYYLKDECKGRRTYRIVYGGLQVNENYIVDISNDSQLTLRQHYLLIYKSGAPNNLTVEPIGLHTHENESTEPFGFQSQSVELHQEIRQIEDVQEQLRAQFSLINQHLSRYYIINKSENSKLFKAIFEDGSTMQNFIVSYNFDGHIKVQSEYLISLGLQDASNIHEMHCNETQTSVQDSVDEENSATVTKNDDEEIGEKSGQEGQAGIDGLFGTEGGMFADWTPIGSIPAENIQPDKLIDQAISGSRDFTVIGEPPENKQPAVPGSRDFTAIGQPPQSQQPAVPGSTNFTVIGQKIPQQHPQAYNSQNTPTSSESINPQLQPLPKNSTQQPEINSNTEIQLPQQIKVINQYLRSTNNLTNYALTQFTLINQSEKTYRIRYFNGEFIEFTVNFDAQTHNVQIVDANSEQKDTKSQQTEIPQNVRIIDRKLRSQYDLENYSLAMQSTRQKAQQSEIYELVYIGRHIKTFIIYYSINDSMILVLNQFVQELDQRQGAAQANLRMQPDSN